MNLKEKEILNLCLKVTRLAIKVSLEEKYHVFCSFSGHVNLFQVEVLCCTQDYSSETERKTLFKQEVWFDSKDTVINLHKMVDAVKSFLTEG